MSKRPPDVDVKQSLIDIFLTPNQYKLDDRFVLRDGKTHPFALVCPGGGYSVVCSFIEGKPIAKMLNEKGISVFILYYRVKNKAIYPAPMDDLARAVKEIHAHAKEYNVDPSNYSIWGSSAGGHLVASFGTENMGYPKYGLPKPGALVLIYPVISMKEELTHMGSRQNLIGKEPSKQLEEFTSVEDHVTENYPPTYIWCGDQDDVVPPENTKLMVKGLQEANVPVEYDIFPGVGHGVGPGTGTSAQGWIDKAVSFWLGQK